MIKQWLRTIAQKLSSLNPHDLSPLIQLHAVLSSLHITESFHCFLALRHHFELPEWQSEHADKAITKFKMYWASKTDIARVPEGEDPDGEYTDELNIKDLGALPVLRPWES